MTLGTSTRGTFALAAAALALTAGHAAAQTVVLTSFLNGAQEVPAVNTPATGTATMSIDLTTRVFSLNITFGTLVAPVTVAHFHRAPVGVSGPVIYNLHTSTNGVTPFITPGVTSFTSPSGGLVGTFPAAELSNLLAGNVYINVHSSTFTGGEIRGQVVPAPTSLGLLAMGGLVAIRRRR